MQAASAADGQALEIEFGHAAQREVGDMRAVPQAIVQPISPWPQLRKRLPAEAEDGGPVGVILPPGHSPDIVLFLGPGVHMW
jgi:hypothetical protein